MNHPIRAARQAAGKTQVEVAEALGVKQQTVSKWDRGAGLPSTRLLTRLAELLDTTVDALLQETAA